MLPSKCMLYVPLVGATSFCLSTVCGRYLEQKIRCETQNIIDLQSIRSDLHETDEYENHKSVDSPPQNHKTLEKKRRQKNNQQEESDKLDTRESGEHQLVKNNPSMNLGNNSPSEYDEKKQRSDNVDKGGIDNYGIAHPDSPKMKNQADFEDKGMQYMDGSFDSNENHKKSHRGSSKDLFSNTNDKTSPSFHTSPSVGRESSTLTRENASNAHVATEISPSPTREESEDDSDKHSVEVKSPYTSNRRGIHSNLAQKTDYTHPRDKWDDEVFDSKHEERDESSRSEKEDSDESRNNSRLDLEDWEFQFNRPTTEYCFV